MNTYEDLAISRKFVSPQSSFRSRNKSLAVAPDIRSQATRKLEDVVLKSMQIVQSQSYRQVTSGGEVVAFPSPTYDAMYSAVLANNTARPMVLKKRDIAFREGINVEPNFVVKCMLCEAEYDHKMDKCEKCGAMVREPDSDEENVAKGILDLRNANFQTLQDVLEEISVDHDIADDGWLVSRNVYQELNGQIVDYEITEFWRIHPGNAAFSMSSAGRIGEYEFTCIYHRDFYSNDEFVKCERCGRTLHKVIAVRYKDQNIVMRYIKEEIYHGSEYNPTAIYGFPPALTMWYDLVLTAAQTKYMADYYVEKKWPSAALFVPAKQRSTAELFKSKLDQEVNKDIQGRPVFRFDPESKHKPEVIKMTDTPEEMKFIEVREESRMRFAAFWGISPIFNADVQSSGGLNNESRQITVMSWATEKKQKSIQKCYLDQIIERKGIRDWHYELGQIEEEDEAAEIQLDILKAQYAAQMVSMGFSVELDDDGKPTKFKKMEQTQDPFAQMMQQPETGVSTPQAPTSNLSGTESVMGQTKSVEEDEEEDSFLNLKAEYEKFSKYIVDPNQKRGRPRLYRKDDLDSLVLQNPDIFKDVTFKPNFDPQNIKGINQGKWYLMKFDVDGDFDNHELEKIFSKDIKFRLPYTFANIRNGVLTIGIMNKYDNAPKRDFHDAINDIMETYGMLGQEQETKKPTKFQLPDNWQRETGEKKYPQTDFVSLVLSQFPLDDFDKWSIDTLKHFTDVSSGMIDKLKTKHASFQKLRNKYQKRFANGLATEEAFEEYKILNRKISAIEVGTKQIRKLIKTANEELNKKQAEIVKTPPKSSSSGLDTYKGFKFKSSVNDLPKLFPGEAGSYPNKAYLTKIAESEIDYIKKRMPQLAKWFDIVQIKFTKSKKYSGQAGYDFNKRTNKVVWSLRMHEKYIGGKELRKTIRHEIGHLIHYFHHMNESNHSQKLYSGFTSSERSKQRFAGLMVSQVVPRQKKEGHGESWKNAIKAAGYDDSVSWSIYDVHKNPNHEYSKIYRAGSKRRPEGTVSNISSTEAQSLSLQLSRRNGWKGWSVDKFQKKEYEVVGRRKARKLDVFTVRVPGDNGKSMDVEIIYDKNHDIWKPVKLDKPPKGV